MTAIKYILIFILGGFLFACDPGLDGDARVYNDTNEPLIIKYRRNPQKADAGLDTIVEQIYPGDAVIINIISGLGDNRDYECCPAPLYILY
jgi:hypothetical protein